MVNGVARDGWQGRFTRDILGSDINSDIHETTKQADSEYTTRSPKTRICSLRRLYWSQPWAL